MIKSQEFTNTNSCLSKAENTEMLFVLLARDPAATVAIKAWIEERLRLRLNARFDPQIKEAKQCIATMKMQREFAATYIPMWYGRKRAEAEKALERR